MTWTARPSESPLLRSAGLASIAQTRRTPNATSKDSTAVARTAASEPVIRYAKQLASATGAELYVLHVVKPSRFRSHGCDWPPEATTSIDVEVPRTSKAILPGRPADMILAYAGQIEADLILMPTHGRSILGRLFLGSTTMEVLRRTERAVWAVKRRSLMPNSRSPVEM